MRISKQLNCIELTRNPTWISGNGRPNGNYLLMELIKNRTHAEGRIHFAESASKCVPFWHLHRDESTIVINKSSDSTGINCTVITITTANHITGARKRLRWYGRECRNRITAVAPQQDGIFPDIGLPRGSVRFARSVCVWKIKHSPEMKFSRRFFVHFALLFIRFIDIQCIRS